MPEPVLDTVVLRVMTFAHPTGLDLLLRAMALQRARFPPDVYDRDEDALPLNDRDDELLSELARGLRYARRQVAALPPAQAARDHTWLDRSEQLQQHLGQGTLRIDLLTTEETILRERLMADYRIGRGEAAGIALALRDDAAAVFVSSDQAACRVAVELDVPIVTLLDILERWIAMEHPHSAQLEDLLDGMATARFRVSSAERLRFRRLLG